MFFSLPLPPTFTAGRVLGWLVGVRVVIEHAVTILFRLCRRVWSIAQPFASGNFALSHLDDDDECIYDGLIADVRRLVLAHNPPVIIVCMDHGELGVLPPVERWQKAPAHGEIGMSAFIVSRDIWMTHRAAFGNNNNYHGDYDFIAQIWRDTNGGEGWLWHPVIASRVQRISRGGRE